MRISTLMTLLLFSSWANAAPFWGQVHVPSTFDMKVKTVEISETCRRSAFGSTTVLFVTKNVSDVDPKTAVFFNNFNSRPCTGWGKQVVYSLKVTFMKLSTGLYDSTTFETLNKSDFMAAIQDITLVFLPMQTGSIRSGRGLTIEDRLRNTPLNSYFRFTISMTLASYEFPVYEKAVASSFPSSPYSSVFVLRKDQGIPHISLLVPGKIEKGTSVPFTAKIQLASFEKPNYVGPTLWQTQGEWVVGEIFQKGMTDIEF